MTPLCSGSVVDGLRVLSRLGQGASAVVYLVEDPSDGEIRALKLLSNEILHVWTPDREWAAIGAVDHPNVARILRRVRTPDGHVGVLMEYVAGPTLRRWAGLHTPSIDDIVLIGIGVLRGLAAIHRASLVHRDVKPTNILLERIDDRIQPRLLDFGLAKDLAASNGLTAPDDILGTPTYMAPDQLLDPSRVGPSADIFSTGVVLFELVTGARFRDRRAPTSDLLQVPPPDTLRAALQAKTGPELPEPIVACIVRMLDADPGERPTAAEAIACLAAHLPEGDPRRLGGLALGTHGARIAEAIAEQGAGDVRQALASTVRQEDPPMAVAVEVTQTQTATPYRLPVGWLAALGLGLLLLLLSLGGWAAGWLN